MLFVLKIAGKEYQPQPQKEERRESHIQQKRGFWIDLSIR